MTSKAIVPSCLVGTALILAALSMRPAITSIATVLDRLRDLFGLDQIALTALTTIPVLMFALAAPIAGWAARKVGAEWAIAGFLLVLAIALAVRVLSPEALLIGTVLSGACITGVSVIAPEIVKRHLAPRVGLWTGIYTTSFGIGAALGAALTVPLISTFGSLQLALAFWAIPTVVAAAVGVCLAYRAHSTVAKVAHVAGPKMPRRSVVLITSFFAIQAMVYFAITSWLTHFLIDRGLPEAEAALQLSWFSIAGLATTLLVPILAVWMRRQSMLAAGLSALGAGALLAVCFAPVTNVGIWVGVLGLAQSGAFGLATTFIVIKTASPKSATALSTHAQGVGYAFAASGPLLFSVLREATGGWEASFVLLIAATSVQGVIGWAIGRIPQSPRVRAA